MENVIDITFKDKSIVALSGNENGEKLYLDQVKDRIRVGQLNLLIFPKTIEMISISYTKGLFKNLVETFGEKELFNNVDVKTGEKWLDDKVRKDIFAW